MKLIILRRYGKHAYSILVAALLTSVAFGADETYYVTKHTPVITDTGVIGVPVGAEVVKVDKDKYKYLNYVVEIPFVFVTKDINVAAKAAAIDKDNQERLKKLAAERAAKEAELKAAQEATQAPEQRITVEQPRRANPLDMPAYSK